MPAGPRDLLLVDAANDAGTLLASPRRQAAGHGRDDPPAPGPLAGARRGGDRDRRPRPPRARADADGIPVPTDELLDDGDSVRGRRRASWQVIHLVGHTPGSVALLLRRPGAATRTCSPATRCSPAVSGNTTGDAADFASLIDDVEHKLFDRLPDDTWFYPGHGDDSTLGAERPDLGEWRARGW